MKTPMLRKYVDEAVGVWMVFGAYPDGTVAVTDSNRDLFVYVDPALAAKMVKAQERFRNELYDILCTTPERLAAQDSNTWRDFKRKVEEQGVEDAQVVNYIDVHFPAPVRVVPVDGTDGAEFNVVDFEGEP